MSTSPLPRPRVRAALSRAACALLLLPLAAAGDPAVGPWTHQAPLPTGLDLHAVHAVSPSEAWAIGDDGVLVHTTDGGASWELGGLSSDSTWAIFFLDAQRGWAAGNGFFHTVDGGQTWSKDSPWGSITDVWFMDAQRGWACGNGGTTYRTTDGGLTWSFSTVGSIITLRSIRFVDAQIGFTVNIDGDIWKSTDGGQSWSLNHASAGSNLNSLHFFDAQEGWAIGGDTFLQTLDGGQSWQQAIVPPGTWVHGACFSDRLHGWGVGAGGLNGVRTSDGGATWVPMDTAISGPRLWDVHFADAQTGFLVGETGVLNSSQDGGATWELRQSGGTAFTRGLDAVDGLHAWAANDGGEVLRTTDGGAFWERVKVPAISTFGRVNDVDFVDLQRGWAGGRDSAFGGETAVIARSTDGGQSWVTQHTEPADSEIVALEVIDAQRVVALGDRFTHGGFILRTTNGGASWQDVSPSKAAFEDVDFVDAQTGWVVGGGIYRTTDGGLTWQLQATPASHLMGVSFADASTGWAVGWQGTVLRTTDGGATWTPQTVSGAPNAFLGVQALSPDHAWLVGGDRMVRRTVDGGATWTVETLAMDPLNTLSALFFLDAENGWVGGSDVGPGAGIWRRATCAEPERYCTAGVNSTGGPAQIGHQGSLSVAANDFALTAAGCPPNQFGIFFHGHDRVQNPLGDGFMCIGSGYVRLPVVSTGAAGVATFALDFTGAPKVGGAIDAGSTWGFQFWYRDPGFGTGSNLSDAIEATFCQ